MCVRVSVHVHACMRACACVRACVCVCVLCSEGCVFHASLSLKHTSPQLSSVKGCFPIQVMCTL